MCVQTQHTAVKTGTMFTAGPYAWLVVKMFITADKSSRRDPSGYEPAEISITTG